MFNVMFSLKKNEVKFPKKKTKTIRSLIRLQTNATDIFKRN